MQGGTSQRGDGDNQYAGILAGTALFGGRGHFVAGAEYQHEDGLRDLYTRPWGRV